MFSIIYDELECPTIQNEQYLIKDCPTEDSVVFCIKVALEFSSNPCYEQRAQATATEGGPHGKFYLNQHFDSVSKKKLIFIVCWKWGLH